MTDQQTQPTPTLADLALAVDRTARGRDHPAFLAAYRAWLSAASAVGADA